MIKRFKVRTDFTKGADGNLSKPAHHIHDMMVANAATFTAPPLTMAAFLLIVGGWDVALANSAGGSGVDIQAKNSARVALAGALRNLGHYVNIKADGDKAIIELSGFPSYSTSHVQPEDKGMVSNVTFIPQDLRLTQGGTSGAIKFRWKSNASRTGCELQTTTGDPNNDAGYVYKGSFTGGKTEIGGYTPGTVVWGRLRKIGRNGETGPWSDPAKLMVT
jgi:hypothetical protein